MADYQKIIELRPEMADFFESRRKIGLRGDVLTYWPNLRNDSFTTDSAGFRHSRFKGKDLSPILSNPRAEVQNHIHFTYEDLYFFVPSANHMRAIVEKRWKYAVYYDVHTDAPFEYEMYDLAVPRDVREVENLGNPNVQVSGEVAAERERLHQKLIHVMETLGTFPHEIEWPRHWGEQRNFKGE